MNTFYNKILTGVFVLFAVTSCQVEEICSEDLSNNDNMVFTFFAERAEGQTKTIRQEDGSVWWDIDEDIKIFCNGVSGKFTSDNTEPAASTSFTGSFESKITLDDITTKGVMALYPYQDDATSDGSSITFSVPSEQIATKGTFGKNLFPCIATSKGTNLSFYNVCSGIKFSVVNDDIRSVTFKTSADEPIAGLIDVDYFGNDMPSVTVKEGVSEVTVYAPDNGYFEPGEFYYITILPPPAPTYYFWGGFTMIYNKDNVSDSITINEYVPLPRSKFGVIEGKDDGLLFIDYNQHIEFADPIMKEMCVNAFDTNGDGELSYAEARDVTDLSKMNLTKKTFKSFDEFQYFINVLVIPTDYFSDSHLQNITLPENLLHINGSAFRGCAKLKSINIPDRVEFIGSSAFEGCISLSGIIELPKNLTKINTFTFRNCSSMEGIIIPNETTKILSGAFDGCSKLKKVNIPEGVVEICFATFRDCSSLTSIVLPESVISIEGYCFYNCSSLTSVNIPEGVISIGDYTFSGCSSLASVNIPEGVISIGDRAFYKCSSLTSVVLPQTITILGGVAFCSCDNLLSVYVKPTNPPTLIDRDHFNWCASELKIYVPYKSLEAYNTAEGWSVYAEVIVGYDYENNKVVE